MQPCIFSGAMHIPGWFVVVQSLDGVCHLPCSPFIQKISTYLQITDMVSYSMQTIFFLLIETISPWLS